MDGPTSGRDGAPPVFPPGWSTDESAHATSRSAGLEHGLHLTDCTARCALPPPSRYGVGIGVRKKSRWKGCASPRGWIS
jgi:hypothetical protein